jgi:hypothetical protein
MNPEGDLNPYAPPQSDVTVPREPEPPMPRPASTKWLLALMWLLAAAFVFMLLRELLEHGPMFYRRYTLRAAFSSSLIVLALITFHSLKRSRITYALGVLYLLMLSCGVLITTYGSFQQLIEAWNRQSDRTDIVADCVVGVLFTALLVKLGHAFIFGLPSRRFYRLTQK